MAMSKIFAIFPIDKSSNTTFLNRIHTFLTSNLESDWHCYKVHFSNEEHEDCIKQSSGSRFIFFMGHGGETKLHGACAVYGEMSVDVAASSENTNFFNKGELTVYSQAFYEEVKFENEVNYISNSSFAGVESLVDGVVIKIEKINNLYNIYIQSSDNLIYKYCNLENIDVHIYSYVTQKEVIGKAILIDDKYKFELIILKDNKQISYYENSQN